MSHSPAVLNLWAAAHCWAANMCLVGREQRLLVPKNSGYKHTNRPILAKFHFNLIKLNFWGDRYSKEI